MAGNAASVVGAAAALVAALGAAVTSVLQVLLRVRQGRVEIRVNDLHTKADRNYETIEEAMRTLTSVVAADRETLAQLATISTVMVPDYVAYRKAMLELEHARTRGE